MEESERPLAVWLRSKRCLVSLCEPEDAPHLFRLIEANRLHLRPFSDWLDWINSSDDLQQFLRERQSDFRRGEGGHFKIKADTEFVGVVALQQVERRHRRAALSYWLTAETQGQGYMHEALKLVSSYAFEELGLHRLEIRCPVDNQRGIRLARTLGFREEGLLRGVACLHGQQVDHLVFSLLRLEWPPQQWLTPTASLGDSPTTALVANQK